MTKKDKIEKIKDILYDHDEEIARAYNDFENAEPYGNEQFVGEKEAEELGSLYEQIAIEIYNELVEK